MRGATFCTDPMMRETVAEFNATLEQGMAYHRSSHAFNELLDAHFEQLCTLEDEYEGQYDELYNAVAEQVDSTVLSPKQECVFGAHKLAAYDFLTSDPPAPIDLVTIFEQNTQLTIISGLTAVKDALKTSTCVDSATGRADGVASAAIREKVRRVGSNESMSGGTHYMALPTVYHKLMLMCDMYAGGPLVKSSGVCRGPDGAL